MPNVSDHTAGVDLGGSLTKIVHGADPFQFSLFPSGDLDAIITYLRAHGLTHLALTGGGSVKHLAAFREFQVQITGEFESSICGANYLLEQQGGVRLPYALVSIGTGTSISQVDHTGGKRITGTAVGGGTLLGLGALLTGEVDYAGIIGRSAAGDRSGVDTLVADIYGGGLAGLGGDVTASNFGKAASHEPGDLGRAMLQMVGEVIAVISSLAARNEHIQEIVYIGGALRDNPVLAEVLRSITLFMGQQPRFLQHGEYSGALGALLQRDRDGR